MKNNKYMQKLNRENSNRGAALVSIIIVMTVVATLALLSLSVAYNTFRMKTVDKKSTDNFYGAEKVLEEITAGLQQEVSDTYTVVFTNVMENYGTYQSAQDMQLDYETEFLEKMVTTLKGASGRKGYYDITVLTGYVNGSNYDSTAKIVISVDTDKNFLDEANEALYIRNLSVSYEEDGYYDKITTDIRIAVPDVAFTRISNMPSITEYALVAGNGLELNAGTAYDLTGRVYVGYEETENADTEIDKTSVKLNVGSSLNVKDDSLFVSEGDVYLAGSAAVSATEDASFWANSVTADFTTDADNKKYGNNTVTLLGKSYIQDDTTVNGPGNTLVLGGQYYGYGNSDTKAGDSSAIIINGTDTTLNLSQLDTLVLAGTSFVGSSSETYEALQKQDPNLQDMNKEDVLMGDSIAVKSNQLVYMVPTECEGIETNPMTYTQYQELLEDTNWEQKALNTYISGLGRSISSYGNVEITPVFTNKTGGAVYLYLEFSSTEAASQYFMENFGTSDTGKIVEKYLKKYVKTFTFNTDEYGNAAMNRIITAGNYLVPVDSENVASYKAAVGTVEDMEFGTSFETMCSQAQFDTLINEEEFVKYVGSGSMKTFPANAQSGDVQAVLVDGNYTVSGDFKGIVIATGDVTVTASSIDGLILCKGKTIIASGQAGNPHTLTCSPEVVAEAMRLVISEEDGVSVMNLFKGNEVIVGNMTEDDSEEGNNEAGNGEGENADAGNNAAEVKKVSDIRKCITYENWKAE